MDRVDDNRLYRALDELLPHKEAIEIHLKNRLGELFDIEYDLLHYDVTSTFFEGQCMGNPLAQRGYSRDQRGDGKQVCIALIEWQRIKPATDWHELSDGCYLLRTNVTDWSEFEHTYSYVSCRMCFGKRLGNYARKLAWKTRLT